MINNTEFSKRLRLMMEYYQLSASAFADKVKVQRSSISHLLSGRNKPSLDFVLKVVKEFDEVELYWLLNGKGNFPNTSPTLPNQNTPIQKGEKSTTKIEQPIPQQSNFNTPTTQSNHKTVERIVLFYTDGTFKEYLK